VRKTSSRGGSKNAPISKQQHHPAKPGLGSSLKDALCELLDNLQIGVGIVSCQGDLVYLNASFCEILRCPPYEEHIGKNINRFIEPASWEPLREALSKGLEAPTEGEIKILAADHDVHVIRLSFAPFPAIQSAVQILATEVTQLARTEKELKRSEASVTTLGTRILQVQDEERRRLARDLHDTVGQELALALMRLDGVVKKIDMPDSNAREGLVEAIEGLRRVESGIRTFSYLLHPPLLDEMGLASALRWFVEGFVKRADFQVELELPEDMPRLSLQLETALFRITQESLSNVLRHSGSRKAWICVAVDNYHLTLSVRDEGKGFDQSRSTSALGVGIEGMKGRLKAVNGTLTLQSGPQGTEVLARVPLYNAKDVAPGFPSIARPPDVVHRDASTTRKRVLIVDDHQIARQGIRSLLGSEPDIEVCGEAENGIEAFEKTRDLHPDLVILDMNMPAGGGFSAARQIRDAGLTPKILIYTTHSYRGLEHVARAAGCDGFVLKSNASQDLIRGIRAVFRGEQFYSSLDTQAHGV